ncbi:MAG: mechanosensitive ion channel domain-containing protein [Pseudomonadota bacterium]
MVKWRLILLFVFAVFSPAIAQVQTETPKLTADLTDQQFQEMLGRLSDEQVRDLLIAEFAAKRAEAPETTGSLLVSAQNTGDALSTNTKNLLAKWPELGDAFGAVWSRLDAAGGVGLSLFALALSFFVGFAVRFFWRRKAAERQIVLAERNVGKGAYGTLGVIGDAGLFLIIDLSSVVAFAFSAMAALYIFFPNADIRAFVSAYVAFASVIMIVWSFIQLTFPQGYPVYRLVAIGDRANRILRWLILGLAGLWTFETYTSHLMDRFGAPDGTPELFGLLIGIVWIISALIGIRALHAETANLLPARSEPGFTNAFTRMWALLLSIGAILFWAFFTGGSLVSGDVDRIASMNLKLLLVVMGFWLGYRILAHYLRAQELEDAVREVIKRTARAVLVALGVVIALSIWGLDPATLREGGPAQQWIQTVVNIGLTALIGWAVWDFLKTFIDIRIAAEQPEEHEDEGSDGEGGLGASRAATLLPLLRSFALAAIGLTCVFAGLSSMGVNVAPLIAGAGVVGLAIGFGAQTLVKDIVSGVFFLIDDAFRRGEYIDLGSVKGTVERISVRSLQLRHHLGAVHTIPFGDIAALTNYSRDWVIMKLPLRLTFDTDPKMVKRIVKRIGAELMTDELVGGGLLEPPKSQGVVQMEDSAMILRVKFKAIPGKQFTIRRELLHRIRAAFEEAGIRFANREVTVRVNEDATNAERREAVSAAASRAVEAEQPAT